MTTTDELIANVVNENKQEIQEWYASSKEFLDATDGGRTIFMWEAIYEDGNRVRMYDEITFFRALTDRTYSPPVDRIISINTVDQSKIKEFILYPTLYAISHSCFSTLSIRLVINPKKGEKLICHWCTDMNMTTGKTLRRQVVGIEKEGHRVLFVISPSGTMTIATNDDVSFEGE